jgi:hypothetical protein
MATNGQITYANLIIMPVDWGTTLSVSGPESGRGIYNVIQAPPDGDFVSTRHLRVGAPLSGCTNSAPCVPRSRGRFPDYAREPLVVKLHS